MKIVSKEEMELIDKESSSVFGIPSAILMENAGIAISTKILKLFPNIKPIVILIGPGNNGGDGLVIARWFFTRGFEVQVYSLAPKEKFKNDALVNFSIAQKLSIPVRFITNINEIDEILKYPFLIDAIFGTGITSEPRPFYKECIQKINKLYKGKIIAVDNPSGLINVKDTISNCILKAAHTITVGLPKINMMDYPAKKYIGELHTVDIGFPQELLEHKRIKANLITKTLPRKLMPRRPPNGHKGTFGHLLIIGGSRAYKGAPILSAIAGLKSGCGLISLASIPPVCAAFTQRFPEGIGIELKENNRGYIDENNKDMLISKLDDFDALVLGPGMGTDEDCHSIINAVLENYNGKILIDADGINIIAKNIALLKKTKAQIVLTPHIREMSRLLGKNNSTIENKLGTLQKFSAKYNATIALKSAVSIIFEPDGSSFFNTTGNEGMASAGSGDVLSGIIGSFLAQGLDIINSSVLATYIHGLAGDIAKDNEGSHSVTASSIIKYINKAFLELY